MSARIDSHQHDAVAVAPAIDHSMLRDVLYTAQKQAREQGQIVVASYSQLLPKGDLLAAYARAQEIGEQTVFYWERPADGLALVGIGEAATCTAPTPGEMAERWHALLRQARVFRPAKAPPMTSRVTGPLCFGGFAFDANRASTPLWRNFPSGLLILPEVLIGAYRTHTFLTLNVVIEPEQAGTGGYDRVRPDGLESITQKLTHHAEVILSALPRAGVQAEPGAEPAPAAPMRAAGSLRLSTRDLQKQDSWRRMVTTATGEIQQGAYIKVVLARSVEARANRPFAIAGTLARLRRRYAGAHIFALTRGDQTFLGATPERLAYVSSGRVETMALAGSAPRGTSAEQDAQLEEGLRRLYKTQSEHAIVADMIREALAPLTTRLAEPEQPQVLKLPNVQHLLTPISGELVPGVSLLDVVAALHPTPAVAGAPRAAALAAIREHEPLDRGWFAGPIGWLGSDGTGEFAVALRSALVSGNQATLFAGCGIVAGSDPDAEYLETCWKLQVMLQSLGGRSPASEEHETKIHV